jgi:selenoprotein W-related protein
LGETLEKRFSCEVELIRGSGGIFDVHVDGKLIYSKFETGGFPDVAELIKQIAKDLPS